MPISVELGETTAEHPAQRLVLRKVRNLTVETEARLLEATQEPLEGDTTCRSR